MTQVIKVSKAGVDVLGTANVPNDYIFDSTYNTFKIVKSGTTSITYTGFGYYSFAHGASLSNPSSFMCFYKFPDGYTTIGNGTFGNGSRDYAWGVSGVTIGTSNIYQTFSGSGTNTIYVSYYIFETPLP